MNIRLMTINDYEDVYNLWLNTKGMGLNKTDDSKEGIEKYLNRNPNTCFVAEENNKILGVILSGHDGRRGFIHHTSVNEHHRNNHIGTMLVDAALEALRKEGINKVALVAFSRNEIGNNFWEHKGFTVRNDLSYRNKALVNLERIDT